MAPNPDSATNREIEDPYPHLSAFDTASCLGRDVGNGKYTNNETIVDNLPSIDNLHPLPRQTPALPITDEKKLRLYALYKLATSGTRPDPAARPSFFNYVARLKFDAWAQASSEVFADGGVESLKSEYVTLARECSPLIDNVLRSRERADAWCKLREMSESPSSSDGSNEFEDKKVTDEDASYSSSWGSGRRKARSNLPQAQQESPPDSPNPQPKFATPSYTKQTPLPTPLLPTPRTIPPLPSHLYKPFGKTLNTLSSNSPFSVIPRKRLDISFKALKHAGVTAGKMVFMPSSYGYDYRCDVEEVEGLFVACVNAHTSHDQIPSAIELTNEGILISLSVRTSFDLLLSSLTPLPLTSEIIVTGISIDGMIKIACNYMQVVPLDVEVDTLAPKFEDFVCLVNDNTKILLVAHIFGAIVKLDDRIVEVCQRRGILIVEDCAEGFQSLDIDAVGGGGGALPYLCNPASDVVFFSFGTIKNSTCLGGGVTIIKDKFLAKKMKMKQNQFSHSTNSTFLKKVFKTTALLAISTPVLYGLILHILTLLGINHDKFITSLLRGFTPNKNGGVSNSLFAQIRHRPAPALVKFMGRNLKKPESYDAFLYSNAKIDICRRVSDLIAISCPNTSIPGIKAAIHTFWLFPVIVSDPDFVCEYMVKRGFDVTRGTSQLGCVEDYIVHSPSSKSKLKKLKKGEGESERVCRNATTTMLGLVYLPITPELSDEHVRSMVSILNIATTPELRTEDAAERRRKDESASSANHRKPAKHPSPYLIATIVVILGMNNSSMIQSLIYLSLRRVLLLFIITVIVLTALRKKFGPRFCEITPFARHLSSLGSKDDATATSAPKFELPPIFQPKQPSPSTPQNIVLTGATGFVGSLILRDLLAHRVELNIHQIILITRSKRLRGVLQSPIERFKELFHKDGFLSSIMTYVEFQGMVLILEGDISKPRLGLSGSNHSLLSSQTSTLAKVIHCAASVSFTQPLHEAAHANITPALKMQELARVAQCQFVYISTAFVHGDNASTISTPLPQDLYPISEHYDVQELYTSMLTTQSLASTALKKLGFPNTYCFSKCVAEHLLVKDKEVEMIIIRPAIVGPSYAQPFKGWAGDKASTLVAGSLLYLYNRGSVWHLPDTSVPVVPVDVVVRLALCKAFAVSENEDESILIKRNKRNYSIHTAAWDVKSPCTSRFTWKQFSESTIHLGCVRGHYSRLVGYVTHALFTEWVTNSNKDASVEHFQYYHDLIARTPFEWKIKLLSTIGRTKEAEKMRKASSFIDLPVLFFYFTKSNFYFDSDITAPEYFNGEEYMVVCSLAGDRFLHSDIKKKEVGLFSEHRIAGSKHNPGTSSYNGDLVWSVTQPQGTFTMRVLGYCMSKVLRMTTSEVTCNLESFKDLAARINDSTSSQIILVPTHRSLLDFILLSYVCFAIPELGLKMPFICAAEDFASLPIIGTICRNAQAFFIKRGRGKEDPALANQLIKLKNELCQGAPIEVFIEGTRSRDRRFVDPKTGFLRCLASTGGNHVLVPISISYERTPEQSSFMCETTGKGKSGLGVPQLMSWLSNVWRGNIKLGRIHITAAGLIGFGEGGGGEGGDEEGDDTKQIARRIQNMQQEAVRVSYYHIRAGARVLNIPESVIKAALVDLGCFMWDDSDERENTVDAPETLSECWAVSLQFGHLFAPYLSDIDLNLGQWGEWLYPNLSSMRKGSPAISAVVESYKVQFELAEAGANATIQWLIESCEFKAIDLTLKHVLGYYDGEKYVARPVADAAVLQVLARIVRLNGCEEEAGEGRNASPVTVINPPTSSSSEGGDEEDEDEDEEAFGAWGFKDSSFVLNDKSVSMKSKRYSIGNRPMPKLIGFLETEMAIDINTETEKLPPPSKAPRIAPPSLSVEQKARLSSIFTDYGDNISFDDLTRCRHGSGQSQSDIFKIRSNNMGRVPDVVVWPRTEEECSALVRTATDYKLCLIPFGGGTNVTHATTCPDLQTEPRAIVSVDMRKMKKLLWVNEEDNLACIEAGITGRELVEEFKVYGMTMGHEPDSYEFSTLGGWIATKASGMKKNRYGNIEDIILEVRVVDGNSGSGEGEGVLWQQHHGSNTGSLPHAFGRVSCGLELKDVIIGSEGNFGIITSCVVKVKKIAQEFGYDSVVLHDFATGVGFMKSMQRSGKSAIPASIRLVDNAQFRLSQVMKGESKSGALALLAKSAVLKWGGFDIDSMVAVSIKYEGNFEEVKAQKNGVKRCVEEWHGLRGGEENGKAGYELTFAIAYLRDFAVTYGLISESFETFVNYSMLESMCEAVKERIRFEHKRRGINGCALVSARVTQLYDEGACVYFYYIMDFSGLREPSAVFDEIERIARVCIMEHGGSLSHHHGIGKHRGALLQNRVNGGKMRGLVEGVKRAVDPHNVFGVQNGQLYLCCEGEGGEREGGGGL